MSTGRYRAAWISIALAVTGGAFAGCGAGGGRPGATPAASVPTPVASSANIPERVRKALDASRQRFKADEAFRVNRIKSLGFTDDTTSGLCVTPTPTAPTDLDFDRSFWVHDRATLDWVDPAPPPNVPADFSLASTLGALASQIPVAPADRPSAVELFAALWDTQNAVSVVPGGAQCTDDGGTVNGFPMSCRSEGTQASTAAVQIGKYWPIGLVNRLDLAHEGWRNCGEHRIVYGRNDVTSEGQGGRAFVIFEAVLPNPRPGCRSACQPVAEFWASLSDPALSTAARAEALRDFYYRGLPGFEPVVHIDHYTAQGVGSVYGSSGSGQIRMNLFFQAPWVLKELSLSLDCSGEDCDLAFVPTMVKANPFGTLWSTAVSANAADPLHGLATDFQEDVLANVASLVAAGGAACPGAAGDINRISYPVDLRFDSAESPNFPLPAIDYRLNALTPTPPPPPQVRFVDLLGASPDRCGLTGSQLVARAMTQSCAGCHDSGIEFRLTHPDAIGPVTLPNGSTATSWPPAREFVHTSEINVGGMHALSPALINVFLPERRRIAVEEMLNQDTCPCAQTFVPALPKLRHEFVKLEDKVTSQFAPRMRQELERLKVLGPSGSPKAANARKVRELRARIVKLENDRQQAVAKAVAAQGGKLPALDRKLTAQATRYGFKQLAEGDPQRATALRKQTIQQLLRSEPPRRTVSGSFRVH